MTDRADGLSPDRCTLADERDFTTAYAEGELRSHAIVRLKDAYPTVPFGWDGLVAYWRALKKYPSALVVAAIEEAIDNCPKFPSVAHIVRIVRAHRLRPAE